MLFLAPLAAACLALPTPPLQTSSPTSAEIKDASDRAVRWLRGHQDPETGVYGSGVDSTAAVLMAMAGSPRAYRAQDGPFVDKAVDYLLRAQRDDGAFALPDVSEVSAAHSTNAALDALLALEWSAPDAPGASAGPDPIEAAVAFLGERRQRALAGPPALPQEAAIELAASLLATQSPDGAWSGGSVAIETTAGRLTLLSGAYRVIAASEPQPAARAATALPPFDPAARVKVEAALERGGAYLARAAGDGLWGAPGEPDAGITAMVVGALTAVPEPRPAEVQAALDRGLDWLRTLQQEDGSIQQGRMANYVTSAAVLALARAGREGDAEVIANAREFLVKLQSDEGEGYSPEDRYYGGVGYGNDERPDLSNLQMALEALSAAGLDPGDEAYQKALRFLERTQNRSESNDLVLDVGGVVTRAGEDGGAGYAPGESKAGFVELADGTRIPRSYGSMTYALLKGYLFAGLDRDDARVEAVWKWITANYTLDVNPGFEASSDPAAPYQGLFYYFYTMARALDLYDARTVVDSAGVEHDWRAELSGRLLAMQRPDGSWLNANSPRWWEGNPVLATAYALLTLDAALPRAPAATQPVD